jgi:hypothetical protein
MSQCKLKIVHPCPVTPDYKIQNCEGQRLWFKHDGISGSVEFGSREDAQRYVDTGRLEQDLKAQKVFWHK